MNPTTSDQLFNIDLIHKYDKSGPRYTSYPTAPMFHDAIDDTAYDNALNRASRVDGPISIYLH
ncbi:MAG: hypothetical protein Q9M13_04355, partial [Mariprofundales bacterium]|nr:hypothetical protein [Mariprofundales bacterium]